MKYNMKDLKGYVIATMDGSEAKIKDILFDEDTWIIRYIEADFGSMFSSNRILIPRTLFREVGSGSKLLRINITKDNIEKCPKPEDDKPISRRFEEELNRHYGTDIYWGNTNDYTYGGTQMGPYYDTPRVAGTTPQITTDASENKLKTSLHSFNEVTGYSIRASDNTLGHVEDMIVDSNDWHISYLVVDTANWLPWGKKVLISISQVEKISYANQEALVNLTTENIKKAPEYDPSRPVDENYEHSLHDFYAGVH